MKRLLYILIVLLGVHRTYAQVVRSVESFREKVLPGYTIYFDQADLTESGHLNLSAVDKYTALITDDKKVILVKIAREWQDSLILVHYGTKKEIWGWVTGEESFKLLDTFALNAATIKKPETEFARPHPWFVYFGGQFNLDNQKNINIALNGRFGFYLLLNRWDLASTFSAGAAGNIHGKGTPWANLGLMSRVHFPIKKIGLVPDVGAELSYAIFGNDSKTFSGAFVVGASWYIGIGNISVSMNIWKTVSGSIGLTIFPKLKKK